MTESARSYGGLTAAERATRRRQQLVEATVAVLAARGESGTTMTAICAEAGLTERYFYESFAGRDDALLAALEAVCDEIATTAVRAVGQTAGAASDRVHAAIGAVVGLLAASPAKGRVAVVESAANPRLRARRHELVAMFADLVAHEAAELYGDEAWPAGRARVHGIAFVAGLAELVDFWLAGELAVDAEELADLASDLFTALARRPG